MSGFGHIEAGKIWVDLPAPILDEQDPGIQYRTIRLQRTGEKTANFEVGRFDPQPIGREGFLVSPLDPILGFKPEEDGLMHRVPAKFGELVTDHGYPFAAEMNISRDAPAGDHEFTAVMTYLTTDGWEGSRATTTIHVNTWAEKWARALSVSGVLLAAAATLAAWVLR